MLQSWDDGLEGGKWHISTHRIVLIAVQFLERDVSKRLTCKQSDGFDELQRHPWFQPIDWMALEAKELPPPFTPDVSPFELVVLRSTLSSMRSQRRQTLMHRTS